MRQGYLRKLTWLSFYMIAISGFVYFGMKYWMKPIDEFSVVNHPWQQPVLKAHILFAAFSTFVFGMVWAEHAWPKVKHQVRLGRRTGLWMMYVIATMILSGVCIQVFTHQRWMQCSAWLHIAISVLFCLLIFFHRFVTKPK